ncbi:hypothetical protein ACWEPC_11795, partial [Nonomuraea sp. NPDC004297]
LGEFAVTELERLLSGDPLRGEVLPEQLPVPWPAVTWPAVTWSGSVARSRTWSVTGPMTWCMTGSGAWSVARSVSRSVVRGEGVGHLRPL